jgi:hypothetical protein
LTHSVVVLNSGTIWDLKEELQSWGLLHEHLNSGRLTLCILLRLSVRNLALSKLMSQQDLTSDSLHAPLCHTSSTPPKHQSESPATVPAAKRICMDVSDESCSFAHAISPVLLCAALKCAGLVSSNNQNGECLSRSDYASANSTQQVRDEIQHSPDTSLCISSSVSNYSNSPQYSQIANQSIQANFGLGIAAI